MACRLPIPIVESPLVVRLAQLAGVDEWTDLGSGDGRKIIKLTRGLHLDSRRTVLLAPVETITRLEANGFTVHQQNVQSWLNNLPAGFHGDCVSLLDVIEHFEPEDAAQILDRLTEIFRVVIIFTPRGFMQQDGQSDPELANDPLMWHRSGFTENDFVARGFLTFYWPIYHFPPNVRPCGAVLAIRIRDAGYEDLMNYKKEICRLYRSILLRTTSLPGFIARLGIWALGGTRGVRVCMRWKRRLLSFAK
jgi:hypothetical protein